MKKYIGLVIACEIFSFLNNILDMHSTNVRFCVICLDDPIKSAFVPIYMKYFTWPSKTGFQKRSLKPNFFQLDFILEI